MPYIGEAARQGNDIGYKSMIGGPVALLNAWR